MYKATMIAALTGACALGCAHAPAPQQQQLASAMAAVRAAEEAGAAQVPEAALQLKLAQEELQQTQKLMQSDDNAKATDKLLRARNDAELALGLAHERTAQAKIARFEAAGVDPAAQTPGGTP